MTSEYSTKPIKKAFAHPELYRFAESATPCQATEGVNIKTVAPH